MMFWLLETFIEEKVYEVFFAVFNVHGETCISQKGARMLARNTGRRRRSRGRIIRFLRRSSGLLLHKFAVGQQRKREKEENGAGRPRVNR